MWGQEYNTTTKPHYSYATPPMASLVPMQASLLYTEQEQVYHIVPGKCPWAITAQAPKIEGGRLHGDGSTIPAQGPTPDTKLAAREYRINFHRASSRPA